MDLPQGPLRDIAILMFRYADIYIYIIEVAYMCQKDEPIGIFSLQLSPSPRSRAQVAAHLHRRRKLQNAPGRRKFLMVNLWLIMVNNG